MIATIRFWPPVLLAAAIAGCHSAPTRAEVEVLVEKKLAERGVLPTGAPSTAPSASSKPHGRMREAEFGAFLGLLDDLMKDFRPALPALKDTSDVLRCLTTDAVDSDTDLKRAVMASSNRLRNLKRDQKRKEQEFLAKAWPLAHHLDYDWQTRGQKQEATSACFVQSEFIEGNYTGVGGPLCFEDELENGWHDGLTEAACSALARRKYVCHRVSAEWKQRTSEGKFIFTYSGTETAPAHPPELMARVDRAKMEVPKRVFCRVADVIPLGDKKLAVCKSSRPDAPVVRIASPTSSLHVGDLISAPLAGIRRDPDGVLFKMDRRIDGKKQSAWAVDAAGEAIKVEETAACPGREEIVRALGNPRPAGNQ
jgi:hypothetical protein